MAIKSKSENYRDLVIDLTGPDGNAFALMGYARNLSNQLDLDFNKIQTEMTSGDYENLIEVFEENFGEFVTLYR
tara:strand:- start:92 stop:313 length:222 start_codon:yes stop_codon:yes gene_type:complete